MLDLDDLPLIDQHVHIFNRESDQPTFDPLATFSLGGDWIDFLDSGGHAPTELEKKQLVINQRQTMIYHEAMHAVARYLGCEPTREAILDARAKRVPEYQTYVRGMYRDIKLESNIVDLGNPKNVSLEEFESLTGGIRGSDQEASRCRPKDHLAQNRHCVSDGAGHPAAHRPGRLQVDGHAQAESRFERALRADPRAPLDSRRR
ncbi:MAG: hypothetical protein E6I96_00800 [Chloroflexi bacterium]|nr:MAG: hypothetical protein E6I96_00800 [Chloroflexota bacterium]